MKYQDTSQRHMYQESYREYQGGMTSNSSMGGIGRSSYPKSSGARDSNAGMSSHNSNQNYSYYVGNTYNYQQFQPRGRQENAYYNQDSHQDQYQAYYGGLASQSQQSFRHTPMLYPIKSGTYDILYSEEGDGEILIETMPAKEGGHLRLITCIDISTLYKEKRSKAIEIAKEYSKLQHPNILCIKQQFELLDNNGTLLFYTEAPDHIAGWKSYCKKKFSTDEMLCIFRQLCEALAYVHDQGLIHRDIHPTRIHSTFGLAKFNLIGMPYNYKKLLKKDNFCGHVNYSAPELIQEKVQYSSKVDIWSLGCCLYYLCTKKDPFEGKNPLEIKQNIMYGRLEKYPTKFDPVLKSLILKCLEKDESKRLDARGIIEYQNKIELETYGEVKSKLMVQKILSDYNIIIANTQVHSLQQAGTDRYATQSHDKQYRNPHFFVSQRYPSYGQQPLIQDNQQYAAPSIPNDDNNYNAASVGRNSSASREGRAISQFQLQQNIAQDQTSDFSRHNEILKAKEDQVASFQQNFQNFRQEQQNQSVQDSTIDQFARNSVKQNFQNNFISFQSMAGTSSANQASIQKQLSPLAQCPSTLRSQPIYAGVQELKRQAESSIAQSQGVYYPLPQPSEGETIIVPKSLPATDKPNQEIVNQEEDQYKVASSVRAIQPNQIILPHQKRIKNQILKEQEQQERPIIPFQEHSIFSKEPPLPLSEAQINRKSEEQAKQQPIYQRYSLTQNNLDKFNSQFESLEKYNPAEKDKTEILIESQINDLLRDEDDYVPPTAQKKLKQSTQQAIENQFSIFNNDCIFEKPTIHTSSNTDDCGSSDIIKDAMAIQEDPSSSESRNELNKDEIEGIVAQIVESSKLTKNQIHYQDGTKYVGEVVRNGRGLFYDRDGSIYDGEWFEDQKSGKGKMLFSDGSVYDGQWEGDKMHGQGVFLSNNGDRYQGYFNMGMKDGYGTMYYRNGNTYQGIWKNDQPWGQGLFHFKNGNYYEGAFINGTFEGPGLMFFQGIGTYKGAFNNGCLQGQGRFEYLNGASYEGEWRDNRKHGRGKYTDADGVTTYTGEWENDAKHGKGSFIQSNTCIIEGQWIRGHLIEMTQFIKFK